MSDVEEPPSKMSKYEEYLDEGDECLDDGQEEWLSEGVLTDDDCHIPSAEQENNDSNLEDPNQEDHDTKMSNQEFEALEQRNGIEKETADHNIESTLNNLDSKNGLQEDLDTFLIRKSDGNLSESKLKEEKANKVKEEDDGNDTDDLLRLLEDNQQVKKKKTLRIVKTEKSKEQESSDDDEFVYEHSKVKTLKLAKNVLIKKVATKAVPEHMSDSDDETDASSDEVVTMKKMFGVRSAPSKPASKPKDEPKKVVKPVVQGNSDHNKSKLQIQNPPLKTTPNQSKIDTKPFKASEVKSSTPFKPMEKGISKSQKAVKIDPKDIGSKVIKSEPVKKPNMKMEVQDEIIGGEEFLEDDNLELEEEEIREELEGKNSKKQRIMKPEVMDEEVPSDDESHSEDGSLYDELPSSDSDDIDDWFTLDVREERASDYLPLLGGCARALLSAERGRAATRVAALRQSLAALTEAARRQADALRHAAMALAEIDDTLRAA